MIRPRNDVVLRRPERGVEVLDDDDLDAGRAEQPEPLLGVEQERRRRAEDHLVGVGVERDDGRAGVVRLGLQVEVAEQVLVAAVEAVEHADDGEDRPVVRCPARRPRRS